MSVMSTTFTALAMNITFLREQGVLKRMRGTPLPPTSYLGGVAANAVSNAHRAGRDRRRWPGKLFFGIGWPKDWLELAVFVVAGVVCFAALGVAFSHVIPNFDAAAGLHEHRLPAGHLHLRRLLRRRQRARSSCATSPRSCRSPTSSTALSAAMVTGESLADNLGDLAVVVGVGCRSATFFAVRGFSWQSRND